MLILHIKKILKKHCSVNIFDQNLEKNDILVNANSTKFLLKIRFEIKNREVKIILSKKWKKSTFRRQNAQIIGKSGFRGRNFDLGGVPVFGTFFGPFCLCFAVFSINICLFYNGKRKVLLCAFVTRFTRNFAKVFFYESRFLRHLFSV
jgi:hypothetical protein